MFDVGASSSGSKSGIAKILANVAWLVGGKGFGAVCSLIYLAILARSLGIKDFGHFSLIFATGQAFVAVAGVQSWQTLVRYGAAYVHRQEWEKFGRLSLLCGLLDWLGAIVGCIAAWFVYYRFADNLGINPDYLDMAFAFNCALLWSRVSAPVGVVRVLDRFDIAAYVEGFVPLFRLLVAIGLWLTTPTVAHFLLAWAVIDLTAAGIYWIAAYRLAPQSLKIHYISQWRRAIAENTGVKHFVGITYLTSTLDAVFKQGPVLAVGYFLGTSAAGVYRLVDQLAQGIGKLAQLVARAIYPEINKNRVSNTVEQFSKLVKRLTIIAAAAGLVVVAIALLAGQHLLRLIGGEGFVGGQAVFVPLALAASFELASVTYEPVLHALNRARLALFARIFAVLTLIGAIGIFNPWGSIGIAWSVALGQALGYFALGLMVLYILRNPTSQTSSSGGI